MVSSMDKYLIQMDFIWFTGQLMLLGKKMDNMFSLENVTVAPA